MRSTDCIRSAVIAWTLALASATGLFPGLLTAQDQPDTQVRVSAVPAEAVISCDGVLQDKAPVVITGLAPGDHLIAAAAPGHYEARKTVSLSRGQRVAVDLKLEPVLGLILLHTDPTAAQVRIDGADRGRTPLLVTDLPFAKYRVQFSTRGYLDKEIELTVDSRLPRKIKVTLDSDSATLIIRSTPPGANVLVNGIAKGATPCTADRIPQGDCKIELISDGFETHTQTFKLAAGQKESLDVVLKVIPAKLSVVTLPAGARVYVDDQFKGESPVTLDGIEPGDHRVRVDMGGYAPMARNVTLGRAQQVVEEFRLGRDSGVFELTTEPAEVTVYFDGKEVGTTKAKGTDAISEPFKLDVVPSGKHSVKLTRKGYFETELTVTIETDKATTHHEKLKRRFIPNYEVRTDTRMIRGILVSISASGDVRMETAPGIFTEVPAQEIRSRRPLRLDASEP